MFIFGELHFCYYFTNNKRINENHLLCENNLINTILTNSIKHSNNNNNSG